MRKSHRTVFILIFSFVIIFNPISSRIMTLIIAVGNKIDSQIFYRQIEAESSFIPWAYSKQGAIGLGQILPITASYIAPVYIKGMLWIPFINLQIAAKYEKYLLEKFNNNWSLTLGAYNWGETNVMKKIKQENITIQKDVDYSYLFENIPETRNYLKKIMR